LGEERKEKRCRDLSQRKIEISGGKSPCRGIFGQSGPSRKASCETRCGGLSKTGVPTSWIRGIMKKKKRGITPKKNEKKGTAKALRREGKRSPFSELRKGRSLVQILVDIKSKKKGKNRALPELGGRTIRVNTGDIRRDGGGEEAEST